MSLEVNDIVIICVKIRYNKNNLFLMIEYRTLLYI
jgi:hypothetical protein